MLLSATSGIGVAIDVTIIALVVLFALIGLHKGFFKSVISMISTLVVIVISFFLAGPFARLINKLYDFTGLIAEKLCSAIASMGAFYSKPIPEGVSGAEIVESIPASTNGFLKKLMSYVLKPLSANDIQGETVANIVSGAFASIIMTIIAGIILFIAIKIIISLASRLFDNITRNKVFGSVNKILGLVFGAIKGFLIVVVFSVVLTLLTVVPLVNRKLSPIIQDHTKIARPIYNYTDEFMEKRIVDGKIVQKWIDNLWENKYKGKGDTVEPEIPTEDGTLAKPYTIDITENEGVFTATITIDFTSNNEQYYLLNPSEDLNCYFNLAITTDADCDVFESSNTSMVLTTLENLNDNYDYILKFTKNGEESSVSASLTLTPIK